MALFMLALLNQTGRHLACIYNLLDIDETGLIHTVQAKCSIDSSLVLCFMYIYFDGTHIDLNASSVGTNEESLWKRIYVHLHLPPKH